MPEPQPPTGVTSNVGSTPLSISHAVDSAQQLQLLPVYCSLLGLVVLGLLVYVVVKNVQVGGGRHADWLRQTEGVH